VLGQSFNCAALFLNIAVLTCIEFKANLSPVNKN
jgi:hypothetical protein